MNKYLFLIPALLIAAIIGFYFGKSKNCVAKKIDNRLYRGIISIQGDNSSKLGIIRITNYNNNILLDETIGIPYFHTNSQYTNKTEVFFHIYEIGDFLYAVIDESNNRSNETTFNFIKRDQLIDLHNIAPHDLHAHKRFHLQNNLGEVVRNNKRYSLLYGRDQERAGNSIYLAVPSDLINEVNLNSKIFYHVDGELSDILPDEINNNPNLTPNFSASTRFDIVEKWGNTLVDSHGIN